MAHSPPVSPSAIPQRPPSALVRAPRSSSRMSMSSKVGGSRAPDDEVKTSVQVAVRIRPPLKSTDPGFELIPQRFQRSMVQVTSPTGLAVQSPQGRKPFVFDKVFGEEIHQEGIWDYVSESVGSFVQGYNVSILAYGQSGAGKSFTMGTSGPAEQGNKQLMGVIPRAAIALFERLGASGAKSSGMRTPNRYSTSATMLQSAARSGAEKTWQMVATYVEIYNEQLRDLLVPDTIPLHERSTVTIREDTKGRILLTGLHQVTITSIEDLLGALNFGSMIRQTDSTAINAKSSRSHAVFTLNLVQRKGPETSLREKRRSMPVDGLSNAENLVTVDSKLHFVDLAGSERLKNTGASGERAKEGISINAGLASLGKVISQLSSRQAGSHVSYRDSKLTRLLQDSLGGNAITYMIACVTPAEFHLSETLNTIQYAERARAIQSKPRIQQVSDDSDKQALIDRLRAEVSFLREQIKNSDRGDRVGMPRQDTVERSSEKHIELQNHLLDVQENYSALSQRHAKLIAEIAKSRGPDEQDPVPPGSAGNESAMERLQRSNSFADAVEQVVLEYEKTIQSLETSLSNSRSSLSATESSLLERETKCAFSETVNEQLQARVRKLIDRETSTEQYLHNLEEKMDGYNAGDEKSSTALADLRKEISRLRENESTCEEYISTLEERLAEAGQDMELMRSEVGRLEHVVDRQRSLGKLDNLLHELDHIRPNGQQEHHSLSNGIGHEHSSLQRRRVRSTAFKLAVETPIPENDEDVDESNEPTLVDDVDKEPPHASSEDLHLHNPAQSRFVEEKLETVNQELFDLRVEHENTINDYDHLSAKYAEALRTLASLQDSIDESRRPSTILIMPTSPVSSTAFLEDARVADIKDTGRSSSRSLSSELASAGDSASTQRSTGTSFTSIMSNGNASEESEATVHDGLNGSMTKDASHHASRHAKQDLDELETRYATLQEEHLDTLDLVEELKAEVQKAKLASNPSSPTPPIIRRKSSQNIMSIDRAHRSLASLGNLATENFADQPDVKQNFELNLTAIMHELHQRSERVQALEIELGSVRKEMESKMTIISGLTRERTTMKVSSPVDMSIVSSMREQMMENEARLTAMRAQSITKEQGMAREMEVLKNQLAASQKSHAELRNMATTSASADHAANEERLAQHSREVEHKTRQLSELEQELHKSKSQHTRSLSSLQASEERLQATVAQLESSLAHVQGMHQQKADELESQRSSASAAITAFELERARHNDTVADLSNQIDTHRATIASHVRNITQLEDAHFETQKVAEEGSQYRERSMKELDGHRGHIITLQKQLDGQQANLQAHQALLQETHQTHMRELDETRSLTLVEGHANAEARVAQLTARHDEDLVQHSKLLHELKNHVEALEHQMDDQKRENAKSQQEYNERAWVIDQLHQQLDSSSQAQQRLEESRAQLQQAENAKAAAEASLATATAQIANLRATRAEINEEMKDLREKEQRASRLVEELEGQLDSTYEQTRASNGRLSLMQNSQTSDVLEARAATFRAQEEVALLTARLEHFEPGLHLTTSPPPRTGNISPGRDTPTERSNSLSSGIRKSVSVISLPSPPPAIPLPPLPPPTSSPPTTKDVLGTRIEEQDLRIRIIEKHLFAEKQLTATLEEALVDLEAQGAKVKADMEAWKAKAWAYENDLSVMSKERNLNRQSLQAVEEERGRREVAEAAKTNLEERMAALNKKKKKGTLNCF